MAEPQKAVFGWTLDREERARLLEQFPPRYPDAVADHVTLGHGEPGDPLPAPARCEIIGHADDGSGVEAMVARIDGSAARPDGGTFHVTWSLDRAAGRRAVESNAVIATQGWTAFAHPIPVCVTPARLR